MAEQQVNLTDLNLEQLQEVKKQLDQVGFAAHSAHLARSLASARPWS